MQVSQFQATVDAFNQRHKKELSDKKRMAKILEEFNDTESREQLHTLDIIADIQQIIDVTAPLLLEDMLAFMLVLYPNFHPKAGEREIVDHEEHECDSELVEIASGMGLVPAMIELFKDHLFKSPCELFGGPALFCGEKIFLSIRCSFRLMGIIGEHSYASALAVYENVDWITAQVGKGRFKAAEAIRKTLLSWDDLASRLAAENIGFLNSMWKHVYIGGQKNNGNGDHCLCLSTTCENGKNQEVLAAVVDMSVVVDLSTKYMQAGRDEVAGLSEEERRLKFCCEMEPTDTAYYLARLIDFVSTLSLENERLIASTKRLFKLKEVTAIIRDPTVHPYLRCKYARMAGVLYMDPVMKPILATPKVRIPADIRAELTAAHPENLGEASRLLSEEHQHLRDTLFEYMQNVPKVMDPVDMNRNRLTRQVFELILKLLRCGDFGEKRSKVWLDSEQQRLETGIPSAEFIDTVVSQLNVDDDVGWDGKGGEDPRQFTLPNKLVMYMKFQLIEMLTYFIEVWNSHQVDVVVNEYHVATQSGAAVVDPEKRLRFTNPMVDDLGTASNPMNAEAAGLVRTSSETPKFAISKEAWTRILSFQTSAATTSVLTPRQKEEVILSCRLITQYRMPKLQAKAFELLFNLALPSKPIATMISTCKVIHSLAEADQLVRLSYSADKLKKATLALEDPAGPSQQQCEKHEKHEKRIERRRAGEKECADLIFVIQQACDKFATITLDLDCHTTMTKLLQVRPRVNPDLARKCLDIFGLMASFGKHNQQTIAEACVSTVILPALASVELQRSALECLGRVFFDNKSLCEHHAAAVCAELFTVVIEGNLDPTFWVEALEMLPILMASDDLQVMYPVCQSIVCRLVCRVVGDLNFPGNTQKLLNKELTGRLFQSGSGFSKKPRLMRGYLATVRVLGIAAVGKLADVEEMIAKLISHERCVSIIKKLHRLLNHLHREKDFAWDNEILQAKFLFTMLFRHVYADTCAKELLRVVSQRRNGIWLNSDVKEPSVVMLLLGEIGKLEQQLCRQLKDGEELESRSPTATNKRNTYTFFSYVFDMCIPTVFHLMYVSNTKQMDDQEEQVAIASVTQLCDHVRALRSALSAWTEVTNEVAILDGVLKLAGAWQDHEHQARFGEAVQIHSLPYRKSRTSSQVQTSFADADKRRWHDFIDEFCKKLGHTKRKEVLLSPGLW